MGHGRRYCTDPGRAIPHDAAPRADVDRELVDYYELTCQPVRDVLVRYLNERRPPLDYSTFSGLARVLAGFWADLEAHNLGIDSLHLTEDVAEAWRQGARTVVNSDGTSRERLSPLNIFVPVRAFYLDIAAWALEDPSWAPWAVPGPVRRSDTEGYMKNQRRVQARMHQRVRDRLPHLLRLVDSAEDHLREQTELLAAGHAAGADEILEHAGTSYRRLPLGIDETGLVRRTAQESVRVEVVATGERLDLSQLEDEAFWTWAIIDTLRHTGVRVEELLERTQFALASHRLLDTGEVIPLLQIVPSKTNQERLLVVTPELASVLASIITRLRGDGGGAVPLTARHDTHERVWGPPRPRLAAIIENLRDRIAEARINGWLGEIQGLQVSLEAAVGKLAALDRAEGRRRALVPLNLPTHLRKQQSGPSHQARSPSIAVPAPGGQPS